MDANGYIKFYEAEASERSLYHPLWQDIAQNIYPRRGGFPGANVPGQRLGQLIYDGTPMRALGLFTSALHSMLTNPAALWFEIWPFREELYKDFEIRRYLQGTQSILFTLLVSSNFHSQVHETYTDLGAFGNAFMMVEPDPMYTLRFSSRPLREIYWTVDSHDMVDGFVREFTFTAKQMAQEFGAANCSEKVRKALEKPDQYDVQRFTVLHIVRRNEDFIPGDWRRMNRMYESVYIELDAKHIIDRSGYYEFPGAGVRFNVASGEYYGYGQGEVALPEARSLHIIAKHTLRLAQKSTDPALLLPHKAFVNPLRLSAGAVNYYRSTGSNAQRSAAQMVAAMPQGTNWQMSREEKLDYRQMVEKSFFVDQLRIREGDRMTAAEINQRAQENQRTLAPFLGRSNTELLAPIIKRSFNIAQRMGKIPPLPEKLQGERLKVKFVSPLARSQKFTEAQALLSAIDAITPFAQTDPTMLEVFKKPKLMEFVFDAFGAPLDVIMNPEEFMKKIEMQQQQQLEQEQMLSQMQGMEQMSGAIKNVASATKDLGGSRAVQAMLQ